MKIYLDDEREAPEGWLRIHWPSDVIALIGAGLNITHISLDHDLGDDSRGTGYDVILWIEEQVATGKMKTIPELKVHSANSSARLKMEAGIAKIEELTNLKKAG